VKKLESDWSIVKAVINQVKALVQKDVTFFIRANKKEPKHPDGSKRIPYRVFAIDLDRYSSGKQKNDLKTLKVELCKTHESRPNKVIHRMF
jgi:hypothetical protein